MMFDCFFGPFETLFLDGLASVLEGGATIFSALLFEELFGLLLSSSSSLQDS